MQCAQCQTEVLPGKRFCHACGAPLSIPCPSCGASLQPNFSFCPDCGHALTADAAANQGAARAPEADAPTADDRFARLSRHIPQGLIAKIRTSKSSITGERKLVTVLFCDLVGSTAIAEGMDPEEYHELLEQYLALAFAEIYRVDGIVNQLAGDGMMALFGAPVAHENAPQRAVHAALAIREALAKFNAERGGSRVDDLQVRIGINTGPVVVGTVGNDLKMDYTAIGDTTNLAARFQSLAEPGMILVSTATERLVRGFFQMRKTGSFEVKGKRAPVAAYEVLGVSETVTPMAIAEARGLTPLVGRRAELSQLQSCFERVSTDMAQVVAMIGEAGSGKSRLLYEFKQRIPKGEVEFLEARCSPLTRMIVFGPWIEMLRQHFELKRDEPPEVSREKMSARLDELGLNTAQVFPYLARLLSVEPEGGEAQAPEEMKRRTFLAVGSLVGSLARIKPVMIVVEDLQWMDELSLEMLEVAVSHVHDMRAMLVMTYRHDYQPVWRTHAALTQLNLAQLRDGEAQQMVRAIAGGMLPEELERRIVVKGEGNPFFVEELTRSLIDEGFIVPGESGVEVTRPVGQIQIPDTIQDLIAARLDRLGASAKRVVQVAAVVGRQFRVEPVAALLAGEQIDVTAELEALEHQGVVHRKVTLSHEEFRFGESLTQEVAYEGLLMKERRRLHDRIAQMLEAAPGEMDAERAALIAQHYARGDDRQKALEALLRAGDEAEAIPSYRAAGQYARQACEVAAELHEAGEPDEARKRWTMQAALGAVRLNVLHGSPDKEATQAIALRGQEIAEELGEVATLAAFYSFRGMDLMAAGRSGFDEGLSLVERGFELARETGDKINAIRGSRGVGWAYMLDGRFEKARGTIAWAVDALVEEGGVEKFADLYIALRWMQGAIHFLTDDLTGGESLMRETYGLALKAPNYTSQSSSAISTAQIHFQRGDNDKAQEWARRSIEVAREIGHLAPLWAGSVILLSIQIERGQTSGAAAHVEEIEEAMIRGANILLSIQLITEGLIALGDLERAERYARLAVERAGGKLQAAYAAVALGDVFRAQGRERWEKAAAEYERALDVSRAIDSRAVIAIAALGAARLAQARGEKDQAGALAREALEAAEGSDYRRNADRARALLKEL